MSNLRVFHRPAAGAAPLLLSIALLANAATAAETQPVAGTAIAVKSVSGGPNATQKGATQKLDLRTPPITETMSQEQIDSVLNRAVEPSRVEEVEVQNSRMRDPDMQDYIPPGFASLFWAMGKPSGMWRLFTPMLVQKTHYENINPTNASQPAPGIPGMAGEMQKVDH